MRLIFATHNKDKLVEMKDILKGLEVEILSAEEAGVFEEAVEDDETFEANALKKAQFVASKTGNWAIADDSGICIASLNGAPGVQSARWAGEGDLAEYTLKQMINIPDDERGAYFESAAVLCAHDGRHFIFSGRIAGRVTRELRGINRPKLPYDVIFVPDGYEETFAEMSDAQKNSLSHRGLAFRQLREFVENNLVSKK